jgi:threonine/homoserine efflux transporter RhtA
MRDVARDPAALELLRVQRGRLADRIRAPWWYLTGLAILWALVFAGPFGSRYLPQAFSTWPILVAGSAVACLLWWGQTRTTGIKMGFRNLSYRPARPAGIAMLVVSIAANGTETSLIRRDLLVAAVAVAALAVAAEVTVQQALLRAIRQDLRDGGGPA